MFEQHSKRARVGGLDSHQLEEVLEPGPTTLEEVLDPIDAAFQTMFTFSRDAEAATFYFMWLRHTRRPHKSNEDQ
jgi:hypothetical protein